MPEEPGPYDTPRPPKSYLGEAVLATLMYYFGLWLGGFLANLYFLRRAREDREAGIPTKYTGCLRVVLWVHVALLVVALAGLVFVLAAGG